MRFINKIFLNNKPGVHSPFSTKWVGVNTVCCRFVHNQMLTIQQERYKNGEKHLSKFQANTYCNQHLKKEYPFLKEVDKFALTHASIISKMVMTGSLNILAGFQDTRVSIKRRSRIPPISPMGILPWAMTM